MAGLLQIKIDNANTFLEKLKSALKGLIEKKEVRVGYTAEYAIRVHEDKEQTLKGKPRPSGLGVYWGPEGAGPKFLEGPAREQTTQLSAIVVQVLKQTGDIEKSLLAAGLHLQRKSQERVPIEYGNLRASAFTRLVDSQGNEIVKELPVPTKKNG